jgi:Lysozyme like domain
VTTPCSGAGGTGTKYTYAQLEGLWINAGGPQSVAPIAAAIALAESGGCTAALNLTDNGGTQTSVGLWQTSNGTHSYPASWTTAAGNAAEAVAKYTGAGDKFTPWGTYDSGAYTAYLNNGTTPDLSVPSSGSAATAAAAAGAASSDCLLTFPGVLGVGSFCLFKTSWARAIIGGLMVGAAGTMGLIGLGVLVAIAASRTGAGRAAGSAAGTALEAVGAGAVLVGAPEVGAAVAGAGHSVRRTTRAGGPSRAGQMATRRGAQARSAKSAQARHDESTAKQVEGRKRDSAKGPALRDRERPPQPQAAPF